MTSRLEVHVSKSAVFGVSGYLSSAYHHAHPFSQRITFFLNVTNEDLQKVEDALRACPETNVRGES
jgi:hypothetical protein